MSANEYLEEVCRRAFERELDVDENVARTLPFVAATMALVVTLYGYAATRLPAPQFQAVSLALHGLVIAGAACLAGVVYSLFQVVRIREYRILPKETEQVAWAEELRTFYTDQGLAGDALEGRIVADLRERLISEYAAGAEHNRAANGPKLTGRARGFTLLVTSLGIAFLIIGIIFTSDRIASARRGTHEQAPVTATNRPEQCGPIPQPEAKPAADPGDADRGQVSGCPSGQHGELKEMTESTPKAPAAPSPPATKPAPPVHQTLKKSETGGGPLTGPAKSK